MFVSTKNRNLQKNYANIGTSSRILAVVALKALMGSWENAPPNWKGADPCGSGWDGIGCTDDRVDSM